VVSHSSRLRFIDLNELDAQRLALRGKSYLRTRVRLWRYRVICLRSISSLVGHLPDSVSAILQLTGEKRFGDCARTRG